MPFKYVLVPAVANDAIQELEYAGDVEDLSKDDFREFLEKYFAGLGASIDRVVLLDQLKQRTGVNLEEHKASADLDRLLTSTHLEIFPVQMPTKDTGFHGVSVYCDDKGIAKNLEENPRMSSLVQACGYVGQTFRGDCFIGRVFDDTEDEWRRVDFTMKDLSTDAEWVAQTKKQREKRSSSDLASLANTVGAANPAHINPSMLQQEAPKGETEQYKWRQTDDEVEVTFKKEGLVKGDKKAVKVVFGRQRLKVEVKGEVLVDAQLQGTIHADECLWTLSDGVLQVSLPKAEAESWPTLLKS